MLPPFANILPQEFVDNVRPVFDLKLWSVDGDAITMGRFGVSMAILVIGIIISVVLRRMLEKQLAAHTRLSPTAISAFSRLIFFCLVFMWVMTSLDVLHIPITAFAFLGGTLAVGLGFGAKDIISNFISGFILMAERPIKIGDVVEVEEEIGKVEAIGIRSTRIHTENNVHIIIPNSDFLSKKIINWTLQDNMVLTPIAVGVAYGTDTQRATRIMISAARGAEGVLPEPAPFVLFWDIADSSLVFQVYFAAVVHNKMERWTMESRVRYAVVDALTEAGIVIAFPQRDIHVDAAKPIPVRIAPNESGPAPS